MALLFSAVTVTAGYDEAEFTVGGIPREYDDLVGWAAYAVLYFSAQGELAKSQLCRRLRCIRIFTWCKSI